MPEQAEQEAEERAETKAAASRDTSGVPVQSSYTVAQIQAMAAEMVPGSQFECFSNIVEHESSRNYQAANPSSGACGLFQAPEDVAPGTAPSSASRAACASKRLGSGEDRCRDREDEV